MARKPSTLRIMIDTREQDPFDFSSVQTSVEFSVERATLKEGDYSLATDDFTPYSNRIAIERKSLADLYGSVTAGRERFRRECARLSAYGAAVIVIEADIPMILHPNDHLSHPTETYPRSVMGTLFHWSLRYNIHVWPCPGRRAAEQVTFRLLEAWRTKTKGDER
jgi:DNA excision repair protein ERCC-4